MNLSPSSTPGIDGPVRRASSKLCKSCQNFDIHKFRSLQDETESVRVAIVAKRAAAGCDFCQLLYEIAKEHHTAIQQIDTLLAHDLALDFNENFWLRVSCLGNGTLYQQPLYNKLWVSISHVQYVFEDPRIESISPTRFPWEICIAAEVESAAYKSGAVQGRYLGQNRTARQYVAALKQWYKDCISSHPQCRQTISDASGFDPYDVELPTRCVEVTKEGSFLRDTDGKRGSYITLSHRWNDQSVACKTTTTNYDERISGQNLDSLELSKNFLDAISVTRALDVRYIWIDSLCIIQDGDDFSNEMWRMGKYYQHSLFTIGAINGKSNRNSDGFLELGRTAPIDRIIRLPYREEGVQRGCIYVYRRKRNSDWQYIQDVDQSVLLSRGWVFQEWRLSRRIIYFSPHETFMECESRRPVSICNDEVRNSQERNEISDAGYNLNKLFWTGMKYKFKAELKVDLGSVLDSWYWCCIAYSSSSLTKKSDVLAAISGIAGEYAVLLDKKVLDKKGKSTLTVPSYLSGLWREDIHHGLLWMGRDAAPTCFCKCKTGGAPSWSWMSFGSMVTWPRRHTAIPALDIVGATSEKAHDLEQMTMITKLRVRGKMTPVLISAQKEDVDFRTKLGKTTAVDLFLDRPGQGLKKVYEEKYFAVCSLAELGRIAGWATFEKLAPDTVTKPKGVICLHVSTKKNVGAVQILPGASILGHDVFGVLFVEAIGRGRFRRIGVGMVLDMIIKEFEVAPVFSFLNEAGVEESIFELE